MAGIDGISHVDIPVRSCKNSRENKKCSRIECPETDDEQCSISLIEKLISGKGIFQINTDEEFSKFK